MTQQARPPRSPIAKLGCGIALIIWFSLLLAPCFMFILATRGEISIATGEAPEQRLRIWLIQEARQSGLGVSNASVKQVDENVCVQTSVTFILWRGEASPTEYCECYTVENGVYSYVGSQQCVEEDE